MLFFLVFGYACLMPLQPALTSVLPLMGAEKEPILKITTVLVTNWYACIYVLWTGALFKPTA